MKKVINVTAEQISLLALMSAAIRKEKGKPENTDWLALAREAYAQSVLILFFETVSDYERMPEPIYQKLFQLARQCTAHNLQTEHTQAALVNTLESGAHPYVILKGEAAAAYYPRPELRLLGDVDFLLQEDHIQAVTEKLKQQGYELTQTDQQYHQSFLRGKEQMELHYEISGIPVGKAGTAVREYLASVFEERKLTQREGRAYYTPCPAHHGLILLLHMQHHMQSHGMGLRHIMDWACFVARTAGDAFWQERLLPLLRGIGLLRYCQVMTKMCSMYLQTACPAWAECAEEDLCRELMEDLMAGGNFGCKDHERARSTNMLPDWTQGAPQKGKLPLLWQTLREAVIKDRPELKSKPVSRLLCMAWKVLRYCALFCVGKRPNIWKAAVHADARRSVYDRLKMFEPEE